MAYTKDQPADVDVGISQPILRANTNTADESFAIDHVAFSVSTNAGYHHFLQFDSAFTSDSATIGIPSSAPTVLKSNIFATNYYITNGFTLLPVFRNTIGVGYILPVAAIVTFNAAGTTEAGLIKINATCVKKTVAPNFIYTITFDRDMANTNYTITAPFYPGSSITTTKAVGSVIFSTASASGLAGTLMIFGEIDSLT